MNKLTIVNLLIIAALGVISYIPLSFYDLVTRKSIPIDLPIGKVYKYSWIASSVSSIVGFGGSAAILIKNHFYKNYVKDKSELTKENFTKFQWSFLYIVYGAFSLLKNLI